MTTGPDELHVLLGAYVLGGLSDDDHRAFTAHLRTCTQCQQELGQVSGLSHLLDLAGPTGGPHVMPDAAGPDEVTALATTGGEVTSLLRELSRRRRRRRSWLAVGAAAAAAAVFAAGTLLGPALFSTAPPTTHIVAAASGSAVKVDVALVTRGWGTQLDLDCADMPTDGELLLWVTDAQGRSTSVASWRATPAGYAKITGATALRPNEIRTVQVRTSTGTVIASADT